MSGENKSFLPQHKNHSLSGISILLLCFNDENTIGRLVEEAVIIAAQLSNDYEVVVVNDASTDNSFKVLDSLRKRYDKFRFINHQTNKGYGGAIKSGLRECKKDFIFYTDGDGQYDLKEIALLVDRLDGVDMVNGFLIKRSDPFYRVILGKIYNFLLKAFFNIPMRYVDCDFRLIRRHVIETLKLESDGGFICAEMIVKIIKKGFFIKEVGIHHYPRRSGKSQFFKIKNIFKLMYDGMAFYIKFRFSSKPLN